MDHYRDGNPADEEEVNVVEGNNICNIRDTYMGGYLTIGATMQEIKAGSQERVH